MKTHIIYIQAEDDLRTAAARLPRAGGERAVLVWPRRGGPQPLDAALSLLLRRATRAGLALALASDRRDAAWAAQGVGLPLFKEAAEAGRAEWGSRQDAISVPIHARPGAADLRAQAARRRQRPQQPRLPIRLALFALGVLAFLLTAALLLGLRA